ncbi:hypothetical protein HanXRQr2_Chr04g0183861 [Helianthus annuus]|uniref:Uncharacterized protein n=1 Tax=Helianthus annuus TaxID=4232 RepID=A0A9K3NSX5_HELAN|nr:hypothetical protein HanXRQr2_Chr04g0183861 [Helianthus annuus]
MMGKNRTRHRVYATFRPIFTGQNYSGQQDQIFRWITIITKSSLILISNL